MRQNTRVKHRNVSLKTLHQFDVGSLLGAPFSVVLHDAVKQKYCADCGEIIGHVIPQHRELIAIAAVLRACHPLKVSGSEIRFLRKSLKAKAKDFASEISISAEQLSRYENDKQPISEGYEKLLRAAVCLGHFDTTFALGVRASELFSMRIRSARCVDEPIVLDLHLTSPGRQHIRDCAALPYVTSVVDEALRA